MANERGVLRWAKEEGRRDQTAPFYRPSPLSPQQCALREGKGVHGRAETCEVWGVKRRETTTEGREEGDEEDDRWQAVMVEGKVQREVGQWRKRAMVREMTGDCCSGSDRKWETWKADRRKAEKVHWYSTQGCFFTLEGRDLTLLLFHSSPWLSPSFLTHRSRCQPK